MMDNIIIKNGFKRKLNKLIDVRIDYFIWEIMGKDIKSSSWDKMHDGINLEFGNDMRLLVLDLNIDDD